MVHTHMGMKQDKPFRVKRFPAINKMHITIKKSNLISVTVQNQHDVSIYIILSSFDISTQVKFYHSAVTLSGKEVIPCQINTKKQTLMDGQFHHYMLYGFRVRATQKSIFHQ